MDMLGDDVWEYNAPQYVDFAAGEDDPDADAWFGMLNLYLCFQFSSRLLHQLIKSGVYIGILILYLVYRSLIKLLTCQISTLDTF